MSSYIIKGGTKLEGEVSVSGSKNASLPILAACILNGKVNKLYNVPDISDVRITLNILEDLGCIIGLFVNNYNRGDSRSITSSSILSI